MRTSCVAWHILSLKRIFASREYLPTANGKCKFTRPMFKCGESTAGASMRKLVFGLAALVAVLSVLAVALRDPAARPETVQAGYFKSDAGARVIAYRSDVPLTELQVRDILDGLTFTTGALQRVQFYSGAAPVPGDVLTLSPDIGAALRVTANPPFDGWDWRYSRNPAGETDLRNAR